MLVPLDGCSGVGKSAVGRRLIAENGFVFLNNQETLARECKHLLAPVLAPDRFKKLAPMMDQVRLLQMFAMKPDINYMIIHFWDPLLFTLYRYAESVNPDVFCEQARLFSNWLRSFLGCSEVVSLYLDAPFAVSRNRKLEREGREALQITTEQRNKVSSRQRWARVMDDQVPYFKLIDATQSPEDVYKQVLKELA